MILKAHDLFSFGAMTLAGSLFCHNLPFVMVASGVLAVVTNHFIDAFGHEKKTFTPKGEKTQVSIPVRTYKTHSFLRATLVGFVAAVIAYIFLVHISKMPWQRFYPPKGFYFVLLIGLIAGGLHLLLDAFTESGIFVKGKRGGWARWKIAGWRYDNPVINSIAMLAGVIMAATPWAESHWETVKLIFYKLIKYY